MMYLGFHPVLQGSALHLLLYGVSITLHSRNRYEVFSPSSLNRRSHEPTLSCDQDPYLPPTCGSKSHVLVSSVQRSKRRSPTPTPTINLKPGCGIWAFSDFSSARGGKSSRHATKHSSPAGIEHALPAHHEFLPLPSNQHVRLSPRPNPTRSSSDDRLRRTRSAPFAWSFGSSTTRAYEAASWSWYARSR